ncbi:formylglycine-generating enzyme family protein [Leeuwenhoekiella marinoflava]|uniref:Formylglycine-generating enzyme required for sulfatase activity n=2 Tax=Leeuwenhoekiella marinoflava TaxID=988 RepID=A0A4Q0PPW1_9FLAO|nr:formylglycine-generating enzyme family protein [Leeuwenhoekiella marinoflava]RXG32541.1 formylglycine-generating enzyme required for sulfatase activity [Leeuwenhoekiella marinoflava]SHE67937.1 Formylglycine-generating enzyme, required for sulfatase activity, contains SUMF1/FGE domain [Leeuwenhoekiella marinoflava DSM 3653]
MKVTRTISILVFSSALILLVGCKNEKDKEADSVVKKETITELIVKQPDSIEAPKNMVWVSGIRFTQGAQSGDQLALPREKPAHPVAIDGFFIDKTEVTNAQFKEFVKATGYITTAERPVDWEEMKKNLPSGTPKPVDSLLKPGSLIFNREVVNVTDLNNYAQWWEWKIGANWQHPQGPESDIVDKDNYPVVHVTYEDALAYCKWANRRLPTEAEWEAAAHGKMSGGIYTWGDDDSALSDKANTWQGTFPTKNSEEDGYAYAAPVATYDSNSLGIFDMSGNVWELTQDWFSVRYYQDISGKEMVNPRGPLDSYNPVNPYQPEKVIKGGSFLCNVSYCASYRISARMGQALDSSSDHSGFRTVADLAML